MTRLTTLLLPIAALFAGAAAPASARPALWRVADADTTIWLFGTIHALPPGYAWRDAAIDRALAGSDALVLETVLDRDPAEVGRLMLALGRSPGLAPLLDRVPRAGRAALAALVARSGLPLATLDGLEDWAAAMALTAATQADLGIAGADGVERTLTAEFRRAGKPVEGLETPGEQIGFLDALPADAQRDLLASVADDATDGRRAFAAMLAAWSRGDERAIARTFDEELKGSPPLRAALVDRRNARWAAWLSARMARPGTIFMGVGAGHLAGDGSLVRLLRARGLSVVRVR